MPTRSKVAKRLPFDSKGFLQSTSFGHTVTTYKTDRKVYSQGDAADSLFYIVQGKVKISVLSEQGKEAVIAILGSDEFFGEACMNGQKIRSATVRTMSESEIVQISRTLMKAMIAKEPDFAEMFIDHLLTRSVRIEEDLVDQLFNSSEKRLARATSFGKFCKRRIVTESHCQSEPGNTCRNDRNDEITRQPFHE